MEGFTTSDGWGSVDMIEAEVNGPCRWVFIANPRIVNAVSLEDLDRLHEEILAGIHDDEIALIVIRGRGGNFCSGDNLKESSAMARSEFRSLIAAFQELAWTVDTSPKPLAAFIEGYALGGGAEIALMCDFAVAEASSVIGFPEVSIGGLVSNGSSAFLADLVGSRAATALVLLSRRVTGRQAADLGLVNFAGSEDECLRWIEQAAEQLAASPPAAIARARQLLRAPGARTRLAALTDELRHAMDLFGKPDYTERTARFRQRAGNADDRPGPASAHSDDLPGRAPWST